MCRGYLLKRQSCRYPRGQLAGVGHRGEFCQFWPVGADPDVVHARAAQGAGAAPAATATNEPLSRTASSADTPTSAASRAASTLGHTLLPVVSAIKHWSETHIAEVHAARAAHDRATRTAEPLATRI